MTEEHFVSAPVTWGRAWILVGAMIGSLASGYLALHAEIAGLRLETNQRLDSMQLDTRRQFQSMQQDMKTQFESVRQSIEGLSNRMASISEKAAVTDARLGMWLDSQQRNPAAPSRK